MKKFNYLVLGLAAVALTSCSQEEDLFAPSKGDGNFNITVKLPGEMATRALGDGFSSINLKYAVFDVTSGSPVYSFQDVAYFEPTSLTTTVSLNLIEGKSYQLAFFACSPDAEGVYTFSPEASTPVISVNYEAMTGANANKDAYDCFFKLTDTYKVSANNTPESVLLTRPVAQINWGTNDINENQEIINEYGKNGANIQSDLTVEGNVYNQLNILTGDVVKYSEETVTLFENNPEALPAGSSFPVSGYTYVACQYVLVPATESTVYDLTLNINNGNNGGSGTTNKAVNVTNAPVQANYRTNIYGNLLSSNTTFTVTKSADWSEPDYDPSLELALKRGGNFTLDHDFIVTSPLDVDATVTLNLNGHNITYTGTEEGGLYVNEGGNLTITGEGSISSTQYYTPLFVDGGTLTIESGNFFAPDQTGQIVYVYEGMAYIKGGYFDLENTTIDKYQYYPVNCYDPNYKAGTANIEVTGGTFINFNPADNIAEGKNPRTNFVPEGYKSLEYTDGTYTYYTVVADDAIVVDENNSMADAIANANDGDTILVMAGTFVTPSTFDKSVTIKGVGAEMSFLDTKNAYFQSKGANLTFEDLSFNGFANPYNHTSMGIQGAANQTFNNVTFNGEFHVFTGNATFNNCAFVYDAATGTNYQLWCQTNGTVDVNNCTMDCANGRAILVYGWPGASGQPANNTVGGDININGLTVTSTGNSSDKAVVEIHSELYTSAGTININNLTYSPQSDFAGLWRDVNSTTKFYTVYVNGQLVQQGNN